MDTPICDFVRRYADKNAARLHMPGHKGRGLLGMEKWDITEIDGADSLYEASGIIAQSEANASKLFGAHTFYSTEGSSLCIRAMLYLLWLHKGAEVRIAAGRNAHKTFLTACALLDIDPHWIYPKGESYLSCTLSPEDIAALPADTDAVYVTSPDYLGSTLDIRALADACHARGMLLLVDNAHGAYLKFLRPSCHPIDLGADMCCDSAHKTLPALTGAAYLHISPSAPAVFHGQAKSALAMFGSTSPSYLILQSLDAVNAYIADGFAEKLASYASSVDACKTRLAELGYSLRGSEPMKICIETKLWGYLGTELSSLLREKGIVCEFADPDFLVLMLSPENGPETPARLLDALASITRKKPIEEPSPAFCAKEKVMSPRSAALSPRESVPVEQSLGRILADPSVGCPPAVPILVCGERIDQNAVECFEYYGIKNCIVVK